ncbi:hypothetical protein MPER_10252 [Moniliophthora perniciosa FA553]|nr:hypothetical protein MPER_10252 [Moniliophthora perniciosa FA553]
MDSFENFDFLALASDESPIHNPFASFSTSLSEDASEVPSAALFNIESCRSRSFELQTDSQSLPTNHERAEAAACYLHAVQSSSLRSQLENSYLAIPATL